MKKVEIIHKEPNQECFEILKSAIIEDKVLKKYRIDKDTLLHELPEYVVNEFLDFLGTDKHHRNLMLFMIKNGSLVITCWEDEEDFKRPSKVNFRDRMKRSFKGGKESYDDTFDKPFDSELPF